MTTGTCVRLFEVEALRDGRLGGAERKSFERHLGACTVCAGEAQSLERLAEAVRRDVHQETGLDELHLWRERNRLLAALDGNLVSSKGRSAARRGLLWPTTVVALAAAIAVFWHGRSVVEPLRASTSIHAEAGTVWSKRTGNDNRQEIALERGVLRIHVEHTRGRDGVLVRLPDGELEDLGTTFSVSADGERTTRVEVAEGKVALRLHGRSSVEIEAGSVWLPGAPVVVQPATVAPSLQGEPARERDRSAPRGGERPLRSRQASVVAAPDPLVDFRTASAALRAGENRQAAAAFARFLADHAGDPMAEDAAYLRVIALQRTGAESDMKRAAQEYLERFPAGFRRAEVERLAR